MRGKRPYTPKVRGCYECSQRRVSCDRGEPSCAKCLAKNISCSGLGVRYRFIDDVARLKASERCKSDRSDQLSIHSEVRGHNDRKNRTSTAIALRNSLLPSEEPPGGSSPHQSMLKCLEDLGLNSLDHIDETRGEDTEDLGDRPPASKHLSSHENLTTGTGLICASPCDLVDPGKRHLLLHFAGSIASELVVIDDQKNGWRFLVLPIANLDALVMDAVLSASAFHFSTNVDDRMYNPIVIYSHTIRKLQQRQNLEVQDTAGKQNVLLALLVLLATVMINGYRDFCAIYRLLESAVQAVGGEDAIMHGELGGFLVRQIRKFRGYASPFMSKAEGTARLKLTASFGADATDGWECFKFYYQSHPEFSQSMSILYELNKQACDIYVARSIAGNDGPALTEMVEVFIETMKSYPAACPGEHILVFATFLAAAECELTHHQDYFVNALEKHHQRNGFSNISLAIQHLRRIWSKRDGKDWTQLLPELHVFIV